MSLKDSMKGLDIMSATPRKSELNKASGRNLMSNIIGQTGSDLRDRLKTMESALSQYEEAEKAGRMEVSIPLDKIDRPPFLMRSPAYFKTDRFYEIKASVQAHGIQEPITVRPSSTEGRYILVKGDTRLTSMEQLLAETDDLRWSEIRARVENLSEENAILMMVIENRDREGVWPYDQAVFYKRVLEELFAGERTEFLQFMGISESWLTKNLAVASIPVNVINLFPQLYRSGATAMYELSKALDNADPDLVQQLFDNTDEFVQTTPAAQTRRLIAFLSSKKVAKSAPRQQVMTDDGLVLGEVKHSKTHSTLRLDTRDKEGFGVFVEERLAEIYAEWKASQI